jgi:glycosyl transferase family 25
MNIKIKSNTLVTVGVILFICVIYLIVYTLYTKRPIKISDAYVINMDKSHDRLIKIQEDAKKANIKLTRWSAIDGSKLNNDDMDKYNISKLIRRYIKEKNEPGVIGCYISHVSLLKHLETLSVKNSDAHLIIEDDAIIPVDFWQQWNDFSLEVPSDWDIIQIGVTFPELKPLNGTRVHVHSSDRGNVGAFAYLVKHGSLPKINDYLKYMSDPIDEMFHNKLDEWKIYYAWPQICSHGNQKSTIVK